MKTKEELDALKEEVEILNKKLAELSEEELKQVVGGRMSSIGENERYDFSIFPRVKEDTEARDFITPVGREKI